MVVSQGQWNTGEQCSPPKDMPTSFKTLQWSSYWGTVMVGAEAACWGSCRRPLRPLVSTQTTQVSQEEGTIFIELFKHN